MTNDNDFVVPLEPLEGDDDYNPLAAELAQAQLSLESAQAEREQVQSALDQANLSLLELGRSYDERLATVRGRLTEQVDSLTGLLEEANRNRDTALQDLAVARRGERTNHQIAGELRRELVMAREALGRSETALQEAQVTALQGAMEKEERRVSRSTAEALETELASTRQRLVDAQVALDRHRSELAGVERDLHQSRLTESDAVRDLEAAQRKLRELNDLYLTTHQDLEEARQVATQAVVSEQRTLSDPVTNARIAAEAAFNAADGDDVAGAHQWSEVAQVYIALAQLAEDNGSNENDYQFSMRKARG